MKRRDLRYVQRRYVLNSIPWHIRNGPQVLHSMSCIPILSSHMKPFKLSMPRCPGWCSAKCSTFVQGKSWRSFVKWWKPFSVWPWRILEVENIRLSLISHFFLLVTNFPSESTQTYGSFELNDLHLLYCIPYIFSTSLMSPFLVLVSAEEKGLGISNLFIKDSLGMCTVSLSCQWNRVVNAAYKPLL